MWLPRTYETALDHLAHKALKVYRGGFMARTAFHRRPFVIATGLDEFKQSLQQAVEETVLRLGQKVEATQVALSDRFDNTDQALSGLTDSTGKLIPQNITNTVRQATNDIIRAIPGTFAPADVTEQAFLCIRVLSQVQDLIIADKRPDIAQSNTTLATRIKDKSYKDAHASLQGNPALQSRLQQAFRDFKKCDKEELGARFLEIYQLYGDIIRHCVP